MNLTTEIIFPKAYNLEQLLAVEAEHLPFTTWANRRKIPHGAGIYFIILDGKVMYIGQASCLHWRLSWHNKAVPLKNEPGLRLAYYEMATSWHGLYKGDIFLAEHYFIDKYKPTLNAYSAFSPNGSYGAYFQTDFGRRLLPAYSRHLHP